MNNDAITLGSIKTEWVGFLLTFFAIALNKKWDLGLELADIVALMGGSTGYAWARTAHKRASG